MYSEEIEKLLKKGAQSLGEKDYDGAVESFGEACSLHQEQSGAIDPDLFLLYGKALYESGVSKSDVLGGQEITNEKLSESKPAESENYQFNALAEEGEDSEAEQGEAEQEEDESGAEQEEDESEAGEVEQEEEEEEGEEKSDLELAWDILEIARGLFEERLKKHESEKDKLELPYLKSDKDESTNTYVKTLKQLSEVYDLLGEVSLESEHFPEAAKDLEHCLDLRVQLYDKDHSSLVGESHFKLSLALEFCLEDDQSKEKARNHIAEAIKIIKNDSIKNPQKKADNDDIIQSLQERYDEIETSAESAIDQQKQDLLEGILGHPSGAEMIGKALSGFANPSGSSSTPAKPVVNDLTSTVRKRKPKPSDKKDKRPKK